MQKRFLYHLYTSNVVWLAAELVVSKIKPTAPWLAFSYTEAPAITWQKALSRGSVRKLSRFGERAAEQAAERERETATVAASGSLEIKFLFPCVSRQAAASQRERERGPKLFIVYPTVVLMLANIKSRYGCKTFDRDRSCSTKETEGRKSIL